MNEVQLWSNMRPELIRQVGGRWDRIENAAGVGHGDVNYCSMGIEGWMELKSIYSEPVRASTKGLLEFSNNHPLNINQINWHLKQANAGGRSFVFIRVPSAGHFLIPGRHADITNQLHLSQYPKYAIWHAAKGYDDLAHALLGKGGY